MRTDRGTSVAAVAAAPDYYGLRHSRSRTRFKAGSVLPEVCLLSIQLPGHGHWPHYFRGKYYDAELGVLDALPPRARLDYYWEIKGG